MNETTKFIHRIVYQIATECCGKTSWLKHRHNIRLLMEKLEPDKPEDETTGFLAYNVSHDKPRMKIKIGRFFTKKLQLNSGYLNDVAIQRISTTVSMKLWPNIETELVNGNAITKAYENAVGSTSCMTGDYADYTRLYESNPSRFQMLIMRYGNNSARAIVHKLDNGKYLLDRVYSDCEDLKTMMINYAIDHNWYYRKSGGSVCCDDTNELIVSGLCYSDGEVPYMDTLTEYTLNSSKMDIMYSGGDGTLDSTEGEIENRNCCENCGDTMRDDDAYFVNDYAYCEDCYCENFFSCDHCGESCRNDDSVHIENKDIYVCQYCADNNYSQCEDCNDYYSKDGLFMTHYRQYVCESCLENYVCCDDCGEYFTSDDMGDDNDYCKDCQPEDEDIPE